MNNKSLIKIKRVSLNELIKFTFSKNIDIEIIKEENNYILCKIDNNNINEITKIYKIELVYIFSNTIVSVNIISNNLDLKKELNKTLEKYNIKRLVKKKNYIELKAIKEQVLKEYNDKIEWIEIENVGMTYIIHLEERKMYKEQEDKGYCNIIASSDGLITKIISTSGVVVSKINQIVKENDLLITGEIKLNDEVKKNICAKGLVYAEKWYNVSLDIPLSYRKKVYTNKIRYNLEFEDGNKDYLIFKSTLKKYDSDKKEIISILGRKLYLIKEYEYVDEKYQLDEESLDNRIDELVKEKLELSLGDNERIISKNVLKKEENNSRIKIELFVTIERLISKQVTYEVLESELNK